MIEFDLEQLRLLFLALLGLMLITLVILLVYLLLVGRRARQERAAARMEEGTREGWWPAGREGIALLREGPAHSLEVEIGGARYRRLAEIDDPKLKRQVVEAAMELVRFTGVLGADPISPVPVDKTYNWREDLRKEIRSQGEQTPPRPAIEGVEEQFLQLLSEIGPAPAAEKSSLASAIKQRRLKAARQEQPQSVLDDIEAILQRRVLLIPALAGRDLHVRQGADGSVSFHFEGHEYEQLDDIPNLTARQLVKDAIQEWDETT